MAEIQVGDIRRCVYLLFIICLFIYLLADWLACTVAGLFVRHFDNTWFLLPPPDLNHPVPTFPKPFHF